MLRALCLLGAIFFCCMQAARANALPTLAELEAAGSVIGEIRINTQNVFDPDDARESGFLYR
jgi:hypothetical protein